ncbi:MULTISPECIES: hypothetical protein [Arthrobacter]|uniref:hypothetical protein n=1 Tax=Arthrobacter TaxID=1663 RepID=UPI0012FA4B1C|nr:MULTISPECIES: hypothetical protein [Arthrobacter]
MASFARGIQSLTLTFPLSQGLGVSRRSFFIGTVDLFAVVAAAVSGLYVALGAVETTSQGWGPERAHVCPPMGSHRLQAVASDRTLVMGLSLAVAAVAAYLTLRRATP